MKIKSDFVTNSSSSSFIVAFRMPVKNFEDVEHLIPRNDKARQVLKDCLSQKVRKIKLTDSIISVINEELNDGHALDMRQHKELDYSNYMDMFCDREGITVNELYKNRSWMDSFYEEYNIICLKACTEHAIEFIKNNEGSYLYIFHYSDEDGSFMCDMEHGGTFQHLPHITISKH